jgi:ABC-type transporter Mla subunit MlaD
MPAGTLCITQAAGNAAAENRRELDATKEKVIVLTDALTEKDRIIADVRATAGKNEADLKEALTRTQTELATKTGQLVGCETMNVRQTAIIEVLLKHVRPKKIGIINF